MDYKELIELSQKAANEWRNDHTFYQAGVLVDSLCSAIETLLEERDAAVEDLKGRCGVCKHRRVCLFDEQHRIGCAASNRGHWEWRGPQKGGRRD